MNQDKYIEETNAFESRCQAAMDSVTEALGFDAWSRDLDDNIVAHAFCVPQSVYDNEELRDELESWIYFIIGQHYLTAAVAEWRPSSAEEKWPDKSRYDVDWCGSRHREVNMGPHLYIEFMPRLTLSRRLSQSIPDLPRWSVKSEQPDCYTVNIKVVPA